MADQLECRLEADPEYLLGHEIAIRFYLTNRGNESVWVLKWNTPLEGIRSNHFIVTRDKQRLPYDGIFIKRGDPRSDEYVRLAPGDTVSNTVDLSTAYPIKQTGQYEVAVKLRIHDVIKETGDSADIPRPRDVHDTLKISCNEVEFRVVGDGTSRLTDGERARSRENPAPARNEGATEASESLTDAVMPIIEGGSSDQENEVLSAHAGAYYKTLSASANLNADSGSGNDLYITWFGNYDASRFQTVLDNYTSISNTLATEQFTYNCKGPECESNWYAYTYKGSRTIYLCNLFWSELPTSPDSQIETVVHELSHAITFTDDIAYGTGACKDLAKDDPSDAIDNADNYGYFTDYLPVIDWGPSHKYDTGSELAVAMDDTGNVVEVHRGYNNRENHYYLVGKLKTSDKTVSWGDSHKYDTGSTLAVAMDNNGNIVEVHCGYNEPENHYYLVGKLNATNKTISWGGSHKYDTGSTLAVAMDNSGNVVEVHCGYNEPENHYYLVGKLNASDKTISWGDSHKYDTGSTLAVAMDDSGNIVEVHRGYNEREDHYYLVGKLNASDKTIKWGDSYKYDTGSTLAVAIDNSGNVVEVHCGYNEPENHYYLVGALTRDYVADSSLKTIAWGAATKYDTGSTLAVAMDNSGNVVEVHCGYNEPENHYYLVGKVVFPG